ncbi:LysR substrate-binding domain-containing protein [Paralimibaculum aggregatum]|uniref:LysR substrate-binding domain-containing protein n=1 Tax=Paralimibaculum aggregatum TaxID=3036245 RepID=A0ABQ6LIX5_9RHOB|nr:LysR substrate-binding domain-containing protein [Limibaculum sp. NKW23]GMG82376.1 LysR substrate-binding domain-containing protein [Limibaculum sp. NKW23]
MLANGRDILIYVCMFARLPSLSALRSFEAAARLRSFKAAAAELSVTPTAVSHQIRGLEAQMGLALFTRGTRSVEPTPAGLRLAGAVHRGLAELLAGVEEAAEAETVLTVTTTPAFAALWLVPRLAGFRQACPRIRLRLETDTDPVDLRRDRRVDLAIRYGAAPAAGLEATALPPERIGAHAAPGLAGALEASAPVLLETAWARPGLPEAGWPAWLAAAGLGGLAARAEIRRFDQEHHAVHCALAGQGPVLASGYLVSDLAAQGLLRPLRPEIHLPGPGYTLLARPDAAASRKVRAFRDWLLGACAGAQPG